MMELKRKTTRRLPQKRRKCRECAFYRALVFQDDGADAFCGRCTKPSKSRIRQVRSATRTACDEFTERGAGAADAGEA